MLTLNPEALMLDETEIKISAWLVASGRGYAHVQASLGQSRWFGVLPCGQMDEGPPAGQEGQES